jgi:hypothetical protein
MPNAVQARQCDGFDVPLELLCDVSPLRWRRVLITGEYRWPKDAEPV